MQLGFRIYALPGCAHCKSAEEFLRAQNVPVEVVYADQLLMAAIPTTLGQSEFRAPVIMSYATEEVLLGCNYMEMARCVDAFRHSGVSNQLRSEGAEGQQLAELSAPPEVFVGTA